MQLVLQAGEVAPVGVVHDGGRFVPEATTAPQEVHEHREVLPAAGRCARAQVDVETPAQRRRRNAMFAPAPNAPIP